MKKKKVLIMTSGLTHGGVNRALLNFLEVMSNSEYDFEVFSLYSYGPFLNLFGDYKLLTVFDVCHHLRFLLRIVSKNTRSAVIVRRIIDFTLKVLSHSVRNRITRLLAKSLSAIKPDVVVSFQEGYTTEICSRVEAKNRIAWIHCDYTRYQEKEKRDEHAIFLQFTSIVCVSQFTAKVFKNCFPSVSERVFAIHNIMNAERLNSLGSETIAKPLANNSFNIVSVGRLDPVKRFSFIPEISRKLKDTGVDFKWYIIGDGGSEKELVLKNIKDNSVENEVIMLGEMDNPYPYIKNASLVVCLSSSEACPNVINEAKILHTPIVTTDFPSVSEYITDGQEGCITPIDGVDGVIERLYSDRYQLDAIKSNINRFSYENESIIYSICELFDK